VKEEKNIINREVETDKEKKGEGTEGEI